MISEAKRRSWEIFGEQMESNSKVNHTFFTRWQIFTRSGEAVEVIQVKDRKESIVKEQRAIMKRWREYYQELLITSLEEKLDDVDMGERVGESGNVDKIIPQELSWGNLKDEK